MNKAIIAVSAFAALAAIVFKTGDFGAIPTKADRTNVVNTMKNGITAIFIPKNQSWLQRSSMSKK